MKQFSLCLIKLNEVHFVIATYYKMSKKKFKISLHWKISSKLQWKNATKLKRNPVSCRQTKVQMKMWQSYQLYKMIRLIRSSICRLKRISLLSHKRFFERFDASKSKSCWLDEFICSRFKFLIKTKANNRIEQTAKSNNNINFIWGFSIWKKQIKQS